MKNPYILNTLLESLIKHKMEAKAVEIFNESLECKVTDKKTELERPILDAYSFIVMMRAGQEATALLSQMSELGIPLSEDFFNMGLELASRKRDTDFASSLISHMTPEVKASTTAFNGIIDTCVKQG